MTAGKCPADALVHIAEAAEADGNLALAVDALKAVLPFVHAKPKPIEIAADDVIELARSLAEVRRQSTREVDVGYGEMLRQAEQRLARAEAEPVWAN